MTETPKPYGSPARGVTLSDVSQTADVLLRAGERPTVEKIRIAIGSGSPNTIGPLLDAWWKRLAGRLDAGPAAFHRLPESVAHVAEALWMQALEEARPRVFLEQRHKEQAIAHDQERLALRSHILTLREGELEARLRDRDRTIAELGDQVRSLTSLLQREQASRESAARRVQALEGDSAVARQSALPRSRRRASEVPHSAKRVSGRRPSLKRKPSHRVKATRRRGASR